MQLAIPLGTVLQYRYRIIGVLGQGGFGQTYLAEDQGRFNERCALKEFIPAQAGTYALEKSKELFRREGQVLYQIRHPQIPQFAAVFEENQRLFLVQDFVEGKTYHTLLRERQQSPSGQPKTFSEIEIIQFLRQMLPVLGYIHSLGIIHRDISPDNIILRQSDQLPVLIDFGVVNEIATQIQTASTQLPATRVGKLGYAPIEQLQTGQVSPSSDLYALAVTCVVLLTGLEPQQLFDQTNLRWNWQPVANVRPALAQILNRMLAQQQRDRYPSASAVEQALQQLTQAPASVNSTTSPPNWSEMQTLAVGQPSQTVSSPVKPVQKTTPVQTLNSPGIWQKPGVMVAIALILMFLVGWGSWAIVREWLQPNSDVSEEETLDNDEEERVSRPLPTFTPRPTPSPTPEATFTPEPTPEPPPSSRRLNVKVNEPLQRQGTLRGRDATKNYRFAAEAGQQLYLSVGGGVLFGLTGPDQTLLTPPTTQWQGTLPSEGDYSIQLQPLPGRAKSDYTLNVHLINSLDPVVPPTVSEPIFEPTREPIFEPVPEPEPTREPLTPVEEVEPEPPTDIIPSEPISDPGQTPTIDEGSDNQTSELSDPVYPENPQPEPVTPVEEVEAVEEVEPTPVPSPPVVETQPDTEQPTETKGELLELLEKDNQGNWEIIDPPASE